MSDGLAGTLTALGAWLEANRPDVSAILRPAASPEDLARLSERLKQLGHTGSLPADLVALLSWHDGQENGYHGDADAFFHALDGGNFLSCSAIAEWYATLRENAARDDAPGYFHDGWLPLFANDYSVTCVDATGSFGAPPGNIVHVDFKGGNLRPFIAPSLTAWLAIFVELLQSEAGNRAYSARMSDESHDELHDSAIEVLEALSKERMPGYPIAHTVDEVPDPTRMVLEGEVTSVRLEKRVGREIHRWECEVDDKELIERSIVLHRSGGSSTEKFPDHRAALEAANARVKAKRAEGFVPFD